MQNIEIKPVADKNEWNVFVDSNTTETFHQTWEWGDVYEKTGHTVWRLGAYVDSILVAASLTVKISARRGRFLLVPHGPVLSHHIDAQDALRALTDNLIGLARVEGCSFVRVAPITSRTPENDELFARIGYKKAPIFVQSEESLVLDIERPEEELLRNMRKSTRYILKNRDSYVVRCERRTDTDALNTFCDLYTKTVQNQGFFGQSTDFIKTEYTTFMESGKASLYFAYYENHPIAAALIIENNQTGYYHYGASVRSENNVPAPHLLQWFIITNLASRGFLRYNFWGIAPEDKPNHPWTGLTIFKKGFGGEVHQYTKTQDFVLSPTYWLNWTIEKVRSTKRGY